MKRLFAFVLVFALALCMLSACSKEQENQTENETEEESGHQEGSETPEEPSYDYAFRADLSAYLPYLNPEGGVLLLANKQSVLGADYAPEELVTLASGFCLYGKEVQMEKTAAMALCAMLTEMHTVGITDVFATSGYRSYARQQSLYNYYCQQEKAAHPDWTSKQVADYVLTYSAYPGTSEHQTGLCADLMTTAMGDLFNYGYEYGENKVGFAETAAFVWLTDNAYKFGFILRYPEDKTDVTGYSYESWHYRFVGQAAARAIHDGGLTLEEYLAGNH